MLAVATLDRVLAGLNSADVRFVIVGGLAVIAHGHLRATGDADIVIDLAVGPATRAMETLRDLGLEPRAPVDPVRFADAATRRSWVEEKGMLVFSFTDPADPFFELDVFIESPLPFDELVAQSKSVTIAGEEARVASIDHLIAMKRRAGRPKDLDDIEELERLRDV